jgi:anaerobic ribonucleoside-triphosphate reductase activating protein
VDGPFVLVLKNIDLRFRGSSNQRLIDVPQSLAAGRVICCGGELLYNAPRSFGCVKTPHP